MRASDDGRALAGKSSCCAEPHLHQRRATASLTSECQSVTASVCVGDPSTRRDAIRAPVARVEVGEEAVAITLCWSAVVELRVAYERLTTSSAALLDELAAECGHSRKHLSRLMRLVTLAPDIVAAILDGRQPPQVGRIALLDAEDLPIGWDEQREQLGFAVAA